MKVIVEEWWRCWPCIPRVSGSSLGAGDFSLQQCSGLLSFNKPETVLWIIVNNYYYYISMKRDSNLFVEMPCSLIGSEYCSCLYAFLMWEKIWMSYICEHFDTKSLWQQKRNGKNFGTDMKNFRGQDSVRATLAINEKRGALQSLPKN